MEKIIVVRPADNLTSVAAQRAVDAAKLSVQALTDVEGERSAAEAAQVLAGAAASSAEIARTAAESAAADAQSLSAPSLPDLLDDSDTKVVGADIVTRQEGYSYKAVTESAHLTTAAGTKLRVSRRDKVSPMMFGARRGPNNPGFNSSPAFVACAAYAREVGAKVIIDEELDLYGGHLIPYGVQIEWESGAYTRQKKRSITGGFLLTSGAAPGGGWLPLANRQGIRLINPQIDGAGYPIHLGTVQGGSTTTTVKLDSGAPNIDDYFNGDVIEITTGTGVEMGWWLYVADYDGASRTITVDTVRPNSYGATAFPSVPPAGASYRIGYNDPGLLLGFGTKRLQIEGGHIKNFTYERDVAYGYGAKAINLERGCSDSFIEGINFENCGMGVYLSGRVGSWTSDGANPTWENAGISLHNIHCLNVGSPLVGVGSTTAGPTGNPALFSVVATDWTCRNAGHNPNRLIGLSDAKEKSGAIVLGGAENFQISGWKVYNDPTYPAAYPSEPSAIGYGLTGPIGSFIQGWGRNISIRNMDFHGNCEQIVQVKRPRSHNVDAGNANIRHAERFDMSGIRHFGTADYVVETEANNSFKIPRSELTGHWEITPDVVTSGLVGPNLGGLDHNGLRYDNLLLAFRKHGSQALVTGTPERVRSLGSNSLDSGRTTDEWHKGRSAQYDRIRAPWLNGQTYVTASGAVTAITLPMKNGIVVLSSAETGLRMIFGFRCEDVSGALAPQVDSVFIPANATISTGVYSAGGGTADRFNVAISGGGTLSVSNRLAGSITWNMTILSGI